MIAKKQAITNFDDVILQAKSKAEMWKNLESNFNRLRSSGLKAAPNPTTFFEKRSIPWTHCFRQRNSTSCQKGPRPKNNLKSPENKRYEIRILGSLGFYSTFIKNLRVDSKLF